jgi:hypothetical protein
MMRSTSISQIGVLYKGMELSNQKRLLKNVVSRVVVDAQGKLLRMELLPPFSYLRQISEKLNDEIDSSETRRTRKTGSCSTKVLPSTLDRTLIEHPQSSQTAEFLQKIAFPQSNRIMQLTKQR